jgi:hypothetical protein
LKALFEARVEDLGPGDFVIVECRCGHSLPIAASTLLHGLRLQPYERIMDLERRLRCRECDQRGTAVVSIKWAGSDDNTSLKKAVLDCP